MYDPRLPLFFPYHYSTRTTTTTESDGGYCREITVIENPDIPR
jgi:hypothetical protein